MNTEDKFYFGKHGQPERFAKISDIKIGTGRDEDERNFSATINSKAVRGVLYKGWSRLGGWGWAAKIEGVDNSSGNRMFSSMKDAIAYAAERLKSSRPGQPERFAISSSDLNYAKSQIRSASPERLREIEQELLTLAKSGDNNAKTLLAYLKSEWDERYRGTHSRPGQPERFDASSLNRGNFAEASSSPMLGKLLSEKQMPDGGWRAVETGGGALVISFEDGDVAGNFARRVAGSGYSATAPVQSIGRYWNVEVKNGK